MVDLINKKKQGTELTSEEINFIVEGINNQTIPDYQITAWTMAICFQGLTDQELIAFTKAIIASGTILDLSAIDGFKVDKHSTGGVGDKTSLVFGPVIAALGLKLTKMSGRSLGITGGTIDKLEAIPNFQCDFPLDKFIENVKTVGMSIISQTNDIVPVDKKIYALRDVSATIDSLPLVAASVMSKKIAMGGDLILLDVKCGAGAFAQTLDQAKTLANLMIKIGKEFNKKVFAVISDMNQPLGNSIGNSLELKEVMASLSNKGPSDLKELVSTLAAMSLIASGIETDFKKAKKMAKNTFNTEKPMLIFEKFIKQQNGNWSYLQNIDQTTKTKYIIKIINSKTGYLDFTNNYLLGEAAVYLGAGRLVKNDKVDINAGIILHAKHGDKIESGDIIMELHTNKEEDYHRKIIDLAKKSFEITKKKPVINPLILEIVM